MIFKMFLFREICAVWIIPTYIFYSIACKKQYGKREVCPNS